MDVGQYSLKVNLKILEKSILETKHPSVDNGILVLVPRLLNVSRLDDVATLLDDIQLDQAVVASALVLDRIELLLVKAVHVADVAKPRVQQAEVLGGHSRLDTSAAVVTTDDDVLDAEVLDGVVDHAHSVEIGVAHEVGDVAVDKCLAGLKAADLLGGDAGVGASDPEVLGCLAGGEVLEEVGVDLCLVLGPGAVVVEEPVVALLEILCDVLFGHCAPLWFWSGFRVLCG